MKCNIGEINEGKLTVSWFHGYKVCEEDAKTSECNVSDTFVLLYDLN